MSGIQQIKSFVPDIYTPETVLLKRLPVTAGLFAKKFKLNEDEKLSFMKTLQEVYVEVTLLDLVEPASFEMMFSEWEEMIAFLEE